jgi:hypothetical protein
MPAKKQKIELIITAIMIVVLLFILINAFKGKKQTRRSGKGSSVSSTYLKPQRKAGIKKRSAKIQDTGFYRRLKDETEQIMLIRDPFLRGPISSSEGVGHFELSLTGILWDKDNPLAIINENIVKIGDDVGKNKVVAIEHDGVILNDGTKDFRLNLE